MDRKLATLIGSAARAARLRLGYTQAEISEKLGITPECYGRMERGHMLPSVETLTRMVQALGISADQLLGVGRATVGIAVADTIETLREDPETRRLEARIRSLSRGQVRLIGRLISNLRSEGARKKKKVTSLR